ncbi:MAG: porin [Candidatus Kapabacteria bacterium]|nr:porin [Candidatus Kapabacteria bacterium]
MAKSPAIWGYSQFDLTNIDFQKSLTDIQVRRINLMFNSELSSNVRFLTDFEFEDGADISESSVQGAIKISQTFLEYSFSPVFQIRAGKFLTDFGLYNKIHDASPSYYPVDAPVIYRPLSFLDNDTGKNANHQRLFGKYMAGVEFLGNINTDTISSQIDYSVGIGFGRWETINGVYYNKNFSVSGRLKYRPEWLSGIQVGTSYFLEDNPVGIISSKDEWVHTVGLDFQYDKSNVLVQLEGIMTLLEDKADNRQVSGLFYLLMGYTLYDRLTPYTVLTTVFKNVGNVRGNKNTPIIGLNYNVSKGVYLKTEAQFLGLSNNNIGQHDAVYKISLAVVF